MTEQDFLDIAAYFAANGIKIPDLPDAGALTGAEQLEAVQGGTSVKLTTAQIAALVPSPTLPTSGTWEPEITGQVGAAAISVIGTSRYSQIGSVVTDICRLSIEMDTGQSLEEFNLSCAVLPATNFASARDIISIWSAVSAISEFDTVNIGAVSGQKYGVVAVAMNGTAIESEFVFQRTYSIL